MLFKEPCENWKHVRNENPHTYWDVVSVMWQDSNCAAIVTCQFLHNLFHVYKGGWPNIVIFVQWLKIWYASPWADNYGNVCSQTISLLINCIMSDESIGLSIVQHTIKLSIKGVKPAGTLRRLQEQFGEQRLSKIQQNNLHYKYWTVWNSV